jgi:hypothetical protein
MRASRAVALARPLYCRANMKLVHHLASAAVLTALTLAGAVAQAEEAPLFGFSLDAYAAPTLDRTMTDLQTGQPYAPTRTMVGLAAILNMDGFALGGVVDGMPAVLGTGRQTMGAVLGWQPREGSYRYQLLGEIGQDHFTSVGGRLLTTSSAPETSLGYVGARVGLAQTFGKDGPFELGAWLFVRKNMGEETATNTTGALFGGGEDTVTQYRLGGYSAGVAFRLGLRVDQKRAPSESTVEVQYEPLKS